MDPPPIRRKQNKTTTKSAETANAAATKNNVRMANFLHATDLGSDTDDEDYVPEGATGGAAEAVSEEENSGEDEDDIENESKVAKNRS